MDAIFSNVIRAKTSSRCVYFLSELYFLIAKFLESGPCKKAANVSIVPLKFSDFCVLVVDWN